MDRPEMPRRKTGWKRGRPRKERAKRRATTRIGRWIGIDPVDDGTTQLRAKKILLTVRTDLQLDAAAVLYGNDYLDRQQFDVLGRITELLQRAALGGDGMTQFGRALHALNIDIICANSKPSQGSGRACQQDLARPPGQRIAAGGSGEPGRRQRLAPGFHR
jgi:hypothetical protein